MIRSAMTLNPECDLDHIGASKARTYKGDVIAVLEGDSVAIVQGYKPGFSISDCLHTCIKVRDLDGLAKACYSEFKDCD
jgi:hypothetical protein